MTEATHIYTGPCSCGCFIDGKRWMVLPGDRVPFGADRLDERAAERLGEYFIPLSEYKDDTPPSVDVELLVGPVWARMTVADLAERANGFEAFSKSGLEALCRVGGISPLGNTSALRERLLSDLETSLDEEEDESFSTLDDIDKMDPEYGMSPEDK